MLHRWQYLENKTELFHYNKQSPCTHKLSISSQPRSLPYNRKYTLWRQLRPVFGSPDFEIPESETKKCRTEPQKCRNNAGKMADFTQSRVKKSPSNSELGNCVAVDQGRSKAVAVYEATEGLTVRGNPEGTCCITDFVSKSFSCTCLHCGLYVTNFGLR